jgi:excisionase family DNA binding protein
MNAELLKVPEVANLLKVADKTVYTLAQKGEISAFKVRGQWRLRRTLLFFNRNCDVRDEEHATMLAEHGEDFADEHRFQVPEAVAVFKDVLSRCREVESELRRVMREGGWLA